MPFPTRLMVFALCLIALLATGPARLAAQCVVQNPSFETVTISSLNAPGYWITPSTETAISGCPGWYTRFYSPDIFWPTAHVPNNFMTGSWPKWPWHGSNYAGVSNGRFGPFHSEILAGTLTSSPTGNWYEVRGRFAKAGGRAYNSYVRVSLDNGMSTARYVVGYILVNDSTWKLFSQYINLPSTPTYNRIVIEGMDSVLPGGGAYFFVDSVDICRKDPCDMINARFRKQPSTSGGCCYDLIVDNLTPSGMPQPIGVRVTTTAPPQLGSVTAGTSWSTTSVSTSTATWGASPFWNPLPTGTGLYAGSFCVIPNGTSPQRHIIEYLGQNMVVICRDTLWTECDAQTPKCIDAVQPSIKCDSVDAAGNQRYKLSFGVMPTPSGSTFPTGANLIMYSPHGTVSPWSVPLSGTYTSVGPITFTDTPPVDSVACIIMEYHITVNRKDTLVCRDTLCVSLPKCPKECCSNFTRQVLQPRITYSNGTVDLSGCLLAGPGKIKRFSATIVSAQTRSRCGTTLSAWNRAFGDIASGAIGASLPGPTFVAGTPYSREAVWGGTGYPACVSFNPCVSFKLRMIFPDPPVTRGCTDTLLFSIRYSFTDCECRTCDTVINYRIVRTYTPVIWGPDRGGDTPGTRSDGPIFRALPGLMQIDMSSANTGTLSMTLPEADQSAPQIRITGMSFRPVGVALFNMTRQGTQQGETIEGNMATPQLSLDGGQSALYDITYSNGENEPVITNIVRFRYVVLPDLQEEYETEDIVVEARIPDATGGDVVAELANVPLQGVRTYVLHVDAENNAGEAIHAMRVQVDGANTKLIAVGPVGDGSEATLNAGADGDGNLVVQVDRNTWEVLSLEHGSSVLPVFLTFSGATNGATINYQTLSASGAVLTSESVQLGSPLQAAGVGSDVDDSRESALWPLYPNPAGTAATVGFRLRENGTVKLSIRDLQGRQVVSRISGEQMTPGDHLISVSTSELPQGTYIVVLEVDGRTYTRTLTVVR